MYCSFKFVYFDFPKKFDNTVYIYFVSHKKSMSIKQVLELNYEQDYTGKTLIQDLFVVVLVDKFIEASRWPTDNTLTINIIHIK